MTVPPAVTVTLRDIQSGSASAAADKACGQGGHLLGAQRFYSHAIIPAFLAGGGS